MNSAHRYIFYGVLLFVFGLLCYTTGRKSAKAPVSAPEEPRVDTLVVRDTIVQDRPVYVRAYVRDSIYVYQHDTVYVTLPREVKVYDTPDYFAEVSGYEPSLDRIVVYPKTTTVTKTVTRTETVRRKTPWGIGIQVGAGVCKAGNEFYPGMYVGIGISYNLIRW